MKHNSLWAVLALVSLCMIAIPNVTGDPASPPWDMVYTVDNIYPEDATPSWTLEGDSLSGSATATKSFAESGDLLRQNHTNSGGGYEEAIKIYRTSLTYSRIDGMTLYARMSLNFANSSDINVYGGVGVHATQGATTATFRALVLQDGSSNYRICFRLGGGKTALTNDYVTVLVGQLYETEIIFKPTTTERANIETYINGTLISTRNHWIGETVSKAEILTSVTGSSAIALEWDLDWVAVGYSDDVKTSSELEDMIDDLRDEIASLELELERLRKQIDVDVEIEKAELPTIPHDSRGSLDDDVAFIDPYKTTTYTVAAEGTGASVALYRPYPVADEVTCISDDLWIGGTFTHLYVNSTSGTEILNTSTAYTYVGLDCENITVESIGGNIVASRITDIRLTDAFSWGENLNTGLFSHRSRTANELAYNMSSVRIYWAFPTSDSSGASVHIDMSSVVFLDADNVLILERGKHYDLSEGGVVTELSHMNISGTNNIRTFEIQFTRESFVETVEYFTVTDTSIAISDTYGNSPYTTNIHFTASGRAFFEGMLVIKFQLTGRYTGEKLDTNTLVIKRSDQSGSSKYTYDSIANELRITDVTVDAADSITFSLFWDWLEPQGVVVAAILGQPLVMYSALLFIGAVAFFSLTGATKDEKAKKYLGIASIVFVLVAVIVIFAVGV